MLLADFGTSYTKLLKINKKDSTQPVPRIVPTRKLNPTFMADLATGHNAKRRGRKSINELIALAKGGRCLITEPDALLLDCGSRDIKFIRYQNFEVADMAGTWNAGPQWALPLNYWKAIIRLITQRWLCQQQVFPSPAAFLV
ncbi:hypothetical protein VU04_11385 [Desulfobulbus sp. TB]|nr:hypothetical protein [Desulfobulbus sp. TB]